MVPNRVAASIATASTGTSLPGPPSCSALHISPLGHWPPGPHFGRSKCGSKQAEASARMPADTTRPMAEVDTRRPRTRRGTMVERMPRLRAALLRASRERTLTSQLAEPVARLGDDAVAVELLDHAAQT